MKYLISIFLASAFSLCCVLSCGKEETTRKKLEGTWGLVHYESYSKIDGEIQYEDIGDSNPFSPFDWGYKITVFNTTGNSYLVTSSYWNNKKSIWEAEEEETWTIKDNRIYMGNNDDSDDYATFSLTYDSFSYEYTNVMEVDGRDYGKEGTVIIVHYNKASFRKMSDLSE